DLIPTLSSADWQSAVSPLLSGCFEMGGHFQSIFMRQSCIAWGVTDLKRIRVEKDLRQLSCWHELRSIRSVPALGFHPSRTLSFVRSTLRRRLQGQTLLLSLSTAMAGRVVLPVAQTTSACKKLLRNQCQCRAHPTVDRRLCLCPGGHPQKTS